MERPRFSLAFMDSHPQTSLKVCAFIILLLNAPAFGVSEADSRDLRTHGHSSGSAEKLGSIWVQMLTNCVKNRLP